MKSWKEDKMREERNDDKQANKGKIECKVGNQIDKWIKNNSYCLYV